MNSIIVKILFIFLSLNALYANTNLKNDLVKLQVNQKYENKAMALNVKGFILVTLGEYQKAIETYNILIDKFKDSEFEFILNAVQTAKDNIESLKQD
jgi:tetratricopeptide (TPR) repeat protein